MEIKLSKETCEILKGIEGMRNQCAERKEKVLEGFRREEISLNTSEFGLLAEAAAAHGTVLAWGSKYKINTSKKCFELIEVQDDNAREVDSELSGDGS